MLGLIKWVFLASRIVAAIAATTYLWHLVPEPARAMIRRPVDAALPVAHGRPAVDSGRATVLTVIDGDTLRVRLPTGASTRVRLLMADAPEHSTLRASTGHHVDCGSTAALHYLAGLVASGDHVALARDPTQDAKDKYGRLLAYVDHAGTDLGRSMIRAGWAKVYIYDHPGVRVVGYEAAAVRARASHAGVYSACGGDFHRAAS
jgi:micrococcal nuclease